MLGASSSRSWQVGGFQPVQYSKARVLEALKVLHWPCNVDELRSSGPVSRVEASCIYHGYLDDVRPSLMTNNLSHILPLAQWVLSEIYILASLGVLHDVTPRTKPCLEIRPYNTLLIWLIHEAFTPWRRGVAFQGRRCGPGGQAALSACILHAKRKYMLKDMPDMCGNQDAYTIREVVVMW